MLLTLYSLINVAVKLILQTELCCFTSQLTRYRSICNHLIREENQMETEQVQSQASFFKGTHLQRSHRMIAEVLSCGRKAQGGINMAAIVCYKSGLSYVNSVLFLLLMRQSTPAWEKLTIGEVSLMWFTWSFIFNWSSFVAGLSPFISKKNLTCLTWKRRGF